MVHNRIMLTSVYRNGIKETGAKDKYATGCSYATV